MRINNPTATLFESTDQEQLLSKLGNPLESLNELIEWEKFRKRLNKLYPPRDKSKGGRPRMDVVMMFKVLILQQLYNLGDGSMEFQIADRSSFRNFLGIQSIKGVPDEKTIWAYRERLKDSGDLKKLFADFHRRLNKLGLIANKGKVVDATLVKAPIQRNTKEENQSIKKGDPVKEWEGKPHKIRQKDKDARWVKKHGKSTYGYKDHIKIDRKSKLIDSYAVGTASEHDSQRLEDLISNADKGQTLYGDSAYRSKEIEKLISGKKIKSRIHKKSYRKNPLKEVDQKSNASRSRIRVRVEHIFGHMKKCMGGFEIRSIGIERAKVNIGLKNLAYNIYRSTYLMSRKRKKVAI
jgi:IS5 family transposase